MPGNIWSGRWADVKRAVLVEQCHRVRTSRCPKCKRGVRYVYSLPTDGQHFFCRLCLGLKYRSQYEKALANHKRRIEAVDQLIERFQQKGELEERARYQVVNPVEPPTMAQE